MLVFACLLCLLVIAWFALAWLVRLLVCLLVLASLGLSMNSSFKEVGGRRSVFALPWHVSFFWGWCSRENAPHTMPCICDHVIVASFARILECGA